MSKSQVDIDRQAVLEAKKTANENNSSQPVLTPAEAQELRNLQAE